MRIFDARYEEKSRYIGILRRYPVDLGRYLKSLCR
jgi:hypothetical protein